jgi:autotransporter-associated beta strand protein
LEAGGGTIVVTNAGTALRMAGPIVGTGKLTKLGDGQLDLRSPNSYAGGTEVLAGELRLDKNTAATPGTGLLTLNGGALTPASLLFGGDAQTVTNPIVVVGTNNNLTIAGNDTIQSPGGSSTLAGSGTLTLNAASGTTLTIGGDMTGFSGSLVVNTLPNLRLHPSTGSSNAVFDLGVGSCYLNNRESAPGGVTIYLGALTGGPSTQVQGAANNDGDNRPSTYSIGGLNLDTLFEGAFSESSTLRKVNVLKVGTGRLTLSGASSHTGSTTVSAGVLALTNSATIGTTTNIVVAAGATLDVSGLFTPTLSLSFGQTLSGNGLVLGNVDTSGGGTVSPGTSIGTLTIGGTAALSGTTVMEVNRGATPKSDKVVATSITLGGTLEVRNLGYNLQIGDTFDLLDGPITDLGVILVGPPGVSLSAVAADGTVTVTGVPTYPQITGTSLQQGTNLVVSGIGGTGFGNYRVLSSTNVAVPVTAWAPVATNAFEFDGSFSFTNLVDPAKPTEYFGVQHQ